MKFWTKIRIFCAVLMFGLLLISMYLFLSAATREKRTEFSEKAKGLVRVGDSFGDSESNRVDVVFRVADSVIPAEFQSGDYQIQFGLVNDETIMNYWRFVIAEELSKYGREGCHNAIERICLVRDLSIGGTLVGGTFVGRTVFVSVQQGGIGSGDSFVRSALHHEIAGAIYRQYGGGIYVEWDACNTHPYSNENPLDIIKKWTGGPRPGALEQKLFESGFLTRYGSSIRIKDICTVHERLMMSPELIIELTKSYPIINKKVNLWVAFLKRCRVGTPEGF